MRGGYVKATDTGHCSLFLENRLTAGRYAVEGRVIALKDIALPLFVVATESDHIAPWRSVYKIHLFTNCPTEFVLTNGGHNAGIVSAPGHARRYFCLGRRKVGDRYRDADSWLTGAERREGSWWPAWADWLARNETVRGAAPPHLGGSAPAVVPAELEAASGRYVLEH